MRFGWGPCDTLALTVPWLAWWLDTAETMIPQE